MGFRKPAKPRVCQPSKQRIRQTARAMIRMDGTDALAVASEHVRVFNSQGLYSLAASWKFIEEEIQHLQRKKTAQSKHGEAITGGETLPSHSASTPPGGQSAVNAPSMPSVISPEIRVVGDLHCTGDIRIEGTVEGQITGQTVTVVEGAQVSGPIHADTVRVSGSVNGPIEGNAVILASTASVNGDVVHRTLSVEVGAQFEGHCSRLEKAINISGRAKIADPKPAERKHSGRTKNVGSGDAAKLQSEIKERIEQ